jgi:hypothetical protein
MNQFLKLVRRMLNIGGYDMCRAIQEFQPAGEMFQLIVESQHEALVAMAGEIQDQMDFLLETGL